MTAVWIVVAIGLVLAVAKGLGWLHGHNQPPGLGFVSSRWIAEQRATQAQHRQ